MPEEQNRPRRSSFGILLSFLLVISLIVGAVILFNNLNRAKEFTQSDFVNYLQNDRVVEVYETPKEQTTGHIALPITAPTYENG